MTRREFLAATAGAAVASASQTPPVAGRHALGLDNFAVRAMGWKAPQLIDYAASLRCDSLFITDFDAFESMQDDALRAIRQQAEARQIRIQLGTWSIDPTSKAFRPKWGSAEEHLALGIRAARALGSPVLRVVFGTFEDRLTDGGIAPHIEQVVKVCKSQRSLAVDAGVKIAVENHAGDMHSTELAQLVEAAGKDFVGVNLDSGNALWTLEDPLDNLRTLAPYVLTTSLRDSAVWDTPKGAAVAWTAMGEGQIDLPAYFKAFRELCPGVPVHIETISGFNREFPFLTPEFWKAWPAMPAAPFARFVALARQGKPRETFKAPEGGDKRRGRADLPARRARTQPQVLQGDARSRTLVIHRQPRTPRHEDVGNGTGGGWMHPGAGIHPVAAKFVLCVSFTSLCGWVRDRQNLNRSSNAFRASVGAVEPVSRSTRTVGWKRSQVLRTSLGDTRAAIFCRHSKRAPLSNDSQWMQAHRSTPQRPHRESCATVALMTLPQRVQRIVCLNPGMFGARNSRGVGSPFGFC